MSDFNQKRVLDALQVLYEEGIKCYKPEYQAKIPHYQAIGLAIARVNESGRDCVQLAYAWLEDWNYHDLCAVLEWSYPIFGQTFHQSDLARLQRKINKSGVIVRTEWNTEKSDYDMKTVNVRVVVDEAEAES